MKTFKRIVYLSLITALVSLSAPIAISAAPLDADGRLNITLAENDIKSPAEETADGYVVFDYSGVAGITGITIQLDPVWFAKSGKGFILTIDAIGGLSISNAAWKEIADKAAAGKMELTLEKGVVKASIAQDGKAFDWSTSSNPMLVSIPYDGQGDPDYAVIYKNNGTEEPKHLIPRSWCENGIVYALAYSAGEYGLQYMGKTGFSDTEGKWMDSAANYLAARNVITGEEQGIFDPGRHVTAAEFTAMLMDLFDVRLQSAETGILTAGKDGNFNPNADITRQDMFTITYDLMNKLGVIKPSEGGMVLREFSDSDKIAGYAYMPLLTLLQNGLISGSQNSINPAQPSTKAEIAQLLYNILLYDAGKTNESSVKPQTTGERYASAIGDVTGDGIADDISLQGRNMQDSPFIEDITLVIRDGKIGRTTDIPLENNTGYKPSLFLGDFNGDGSNDILISVESGGSGAFTYDYVYSFTERTPAILFSSDSYNEAYEYGVSYKNACRVEVYSKNNNTKYTIDIGNRDRSYLNQIYDSSNKLIKSADGFVNPLSSLFPTDFDHDGVYELLAFQKIAGLNNADSLGYIENFLKWENEKFILTNQYVGTIGIQDNPMDKYSELKDKNAPPAEIIKFSKENLASMNKEDADIVVKGLINAQKLELKSYGNKLFSPDFNAKINSYKIKDLQTPDKIKDADLKSFLQDAFSDGFKLFEAEGMKDLEIDYEALYSGFSKYLSDELAAYIGIMAETSRQHPFEDGALMITWDQLADRLVRIEDYLGKYPAGGYTKELGSVHSEYLSAYLLGLNNTPAFDMETAEIKPEVQKSYMTAKSKYPESDLSDILTDYLKLLEKNDNMKTKEVLQYVGKITGNPEYGNTE